MTKNTCFIQSPDILTKDILDDAVLLHETTGAYYSLNGTGAMIWRSCARKVSFQEILNRVAANYDASGEHLEQDVSGYLEELVKASLLKEVDS